MNIKKYHLKADSTLTYFEFISIGPNGAIRKMIEFQTTSIPGVYNLAFGDKNADTNEFDDLTISHNGDTEQVLGTVTAALYAFFDRKPEALVYATGSTPARTWLYRMGITKFFDEIKQDFHLFGQVGEEMEVFEVGKEYDGFLAKRKFD